MAHFTSDQKRIISEIQRIAKQLGNDSLTQREFDEHHELGGRTTARNQFGSWNEAVEAAGLIPNESGGQGSSRSFTDQELLEEILRLHRQLGRSPTEAKLSALGKYSLKPYKDRWGTFSNAKRQAYALYGEPDAP